MAAITGARGTINVEQAQRRIDMSAAIDLLEPDAAPLTLLSKRASKKATVNPQFKWLQDVLAPRFDAINFGAGYAAGATSVVVDNGSYFAEHDLVEVTRTRELMRVTAVATNTLTVVRGVGSTAAAIVDNDELLIIGSAQPEGDTSKPARSDNPTSATNYTQIFRLPWEATETWRHSESETRPDDWEHQANLKGIEHAKDIEYAFWMGRPSENTTGSQPRRTTGGAFHFITTNILDAGGTLTETELSTAFRTAFRYGRKRKVAFMSALTTSVVNAFAQGRLETRQGEGTYGLAIREFISPFGTFDVVTHWLFEGTKYSGYTAILDMEYVSYRYLANQRGSRDTHINDNIQARDADTMKSEYLTEAGLQFGQEKAHQLITGTTG